MLTCSVRVEIGKRSFNCSNKDSWKLRCLQMILYNAYASSLS